jgi:DNA topoisomerase I
VELAVGLLALPRSLGVHPQTGGKLSASLGRFGPYILHDQGKDGKEYRSIKAGDDVLTITSERALAILAEPKATRGGKTREPIRQLGAHPIDSEPVNIYTGPYGNYIKHGKVNVGIPEGETVESVTLEMAVKLLSDKEPAKKKRTSTKAATKTTKKAPAKKAAATKTTVAKKTTKKASTKATGTKSSG